MSLVRSFPLVLALSLSLGASLVAPAAEACGLPFDVVTDADRASITDAIVRHYVVRFDDPTPTVGDILLEGADARAWVFVGDDAREIPLHFDGARWNVVSQ